MHPWRIRNREPRAEIVIIPIVVALLAAICRTSQVELDKFILVRRDTLGHVSPALQEPLAQAEIRSDLQTLGFPRRREQGIPKAIGEREVRLDLPRILHVHLVCRLLLEKKKKYPI